MSSILSCVNIKKEDYIKMHNKNLIFLSIFSMLLSSCNFNLFSTTKDSHKHVAGEPIIENKIEASCIQDGSYDLVTYCISDHVELKRESKVIPALGHDLIHHEGKQATYTESGYEPYDCCSRCNYTTFVEIPALTINEPTFEEEINSLIDIDTRTDKTDIDVGNFDNRLYDVGTDFTFEVSSNLLLDDLYNAISIVDQDNENVSFNLHLNKDGYYLVSPKEEYQSGSIYSVFLQDGVSFKNKDESVKELIFNVYRKSDNQIELNKQVLNFFPISSVIDISITEESNFILSTQKLNLSKGDYFCFTVDEKINSESIIGEFDYEISENNYYCIYFVSPNLEEIFSKFDVNATEKASLEDIEFYDKEVIRSQILNNRSIANLEQALRNVSKKENLLLDASKDFFSQFNSKF